MIAQRVLPKNVVYPTTTEQTTPTIPSEILIDSDDITPPQVSVESDENQEISLSEEIEDVESIKLVEKDKTSDADISFQKTSKIQDKVIQSGYESLKKYQTRVITTPFDKSGNYIMPKIQEKQEHEQINPFPSETVNKFKHQYKSGHQVQADFDRISGREKKELKEVTLPEKIRQRGYWSNIAYQDANGLNGHQKLKLINETGTTFPQFM